MIAISIDVDGIRPAKASDEGAFAVERRLWSVYLKADGYRRDLAHKLRAAEGWMAIARDGIIRAGRPLTDAELAELAGVP